MKKNLITGLTLMVLSLVCALLLSIVNGFTSKQIEETRAKAINNKIATLVNASGINYSDYEQVNFSIEDYKGDSINESVQSAYGLKKNDSYEYYLYVIDEAGYAGTIEMLVLVDSDAKIRNYTVISQKETKGSIESHAKENSGDGFNVIGKDNLDSFDALSGSTFSSNAVYRIFNIALHWSAVDGGRR